MKVLIFSLYAFVLSITASGQIRISGRVAAPDGKPLPFVNVFLLHGQDSSLSRGGISNDSGEYAMNRIDPGKYFLRYSAVGYLTWNSPSFDMMAAGGGRDFGTRVMETDTRELKEVTVQAKKPLYQQQIEGLVVNVESSVLTKGSSALEVLERSPGVYIDHQNSSISLNGKNGVLVMVNGKSMRLTVTQVVTLLNSMSADNIEKIELLTTPPARYDADGTAGIINIVLKKNKKQGTNGSLTATAGYGWGEKGSGSLNLAHNTGKMDVYGSYSVSHDRSYSDWYAAGSQNVPLMGGPMTFEFWNMTRPVYNNNNAGIGLDARPGSGWSIGSSLAYNISSVSSGITNRGIYHIEPDSLLLLNADISSVNRWKNLIASLYTQKEIGEGERISVDVDYLYYNNKNPTNVRSPFLDKDGNEIDTNDSIFSPQHTGFANTDINIGVFKTDFFKQLNKKMKLEAGLKGTYTGSSSLSGIESLINGTWVNSLGSPDNISMKEGIGAGYASLNTQIDPASDLVIGVRYEYSHTRLEDVPTGKTIVSRKLGELFPNIFFSRKLADNSALQMSYTRRISRPSYNDLASFVTYNDPISVYTGNPLLKPTITNNLKLGYNYKEYSFSLLASRDDYPIARFQVTPDPTGSIIYISPQNLTYQNYLTFQTNIPVKVSGWWNMNAGFVGGLRQFKLEYTKEAVNKTYFGYSAYFNQTFKLPKSYSAEISAWYNSLTYNGTIKTDGFGSVSAGFKKELRNNGGSFQLSVSDLFRTMNIISSYGTLTQEAFSLRSRLSYNTESRRSTIVKLTYSRSFGDNKMKSERPQQNGSGDERERVRKN